MKKAIEKPRCKNLDLWIILGVITIFAIVAIILLVVRPGEHKTIKDIKELTTENYNILDQDEKERFVFVYDSTDATHEQLYNVVVRYANFANSHRLAPDIYVIDISTNTTIIKDLETEKVSPRTAPCLVQLTNENETIKYKSTGTASDICNMLEDYISGKTELKK